MQLSCIFIKVKDDERERGRNAKGGICLQEFTPLLRPKIIVFKKTWKYITDVPFAFEQDRIYQ